MSDIFYRTVRFLGRHVFWASSSPVVLGTEHGGRGGAFILAATHSSPYDVPLLMRHARRPLDFVSIVEVFRNPIVAWFYGSLNAFPLDRARADSKTVRVILDRLARGRVVAMFPEGAIKRGPDSVLVSRRIRPGIARLAALAGVPIVPCVLVNSGAYSRPASWLPFRRTRYGVIFGPPIAAAGEHNVVEAELVEAFLRLHGELARAMSYGTIVRED